MLNVTSQRLFLLDIWQLSLTRTMDWQYYSLLDDDNWSLGGVTFLAHYGKLNFVQSLISCLWKKTKVQIVRENTATLSFCLECSYVTNICYCVHSLNTSGLTSFKPKHRIITVVIIRVVFFFLPHVTFYLLWSGSQCLRPFLYLLTFDRGKPINLWHCINELKV